MLDRFGLTSFVLLMAPSAALAQSVVAASPDVTIPLGAAHVVTSDHAVAADNQLGIVALQNLGAIADSADVTGYADAGAGMREAGARGGQADVEGQDEIERAAETIAVDRGHGQTRQLLDGGEDLLPEACELVGLRGGEMLHLRHVGAGGEETLLRGAEEQHRRRRRKDLPQFTQGVAGQQVHPAVVECDLGAVRRVRDAEPRHQAGSVTKGESRRGWH